jgi:two-component system phosphate regulon sensor histidine kinase PhoR
MISLGRIWKLYVFYTILLIAGVSLVGFIVQKQIKNAMEGHLKEDVTILARVIAKVVPDTEDSSALDPFCADYGMTAAIRLSIIGRDGKLIGESHREPVDIESRLNRPEVQEAMKGRIGTVIRYSESVNMEMLYVALPVDPKGRILRVAMPMARVKSFQNDVMILFSLALYLMPILVMVAAFFFAKYRIQDMTPRKRVGA